MSHPVADERKQLMSRLLPDGPPSLWCPLLTHYTSNGEIDLPRMTAHLRHISRWVKGYLIPGTTGDGWELSDSETRQVLEFAVRSAPELDMRILVGVLKPGADEIRDGVIASAALIRSLTGAANDDDAVEQAGVCGFAVCPPRGAGRSQQEIQDALAAVLDLGLPTALYQLPQVTENEMGPETVAGLAERFPNLILLKDSSGRDRVALAEHDYGGIFLVRGAEGDYARWLRAAGGSYDGLLLSTANCFPEQLAQLIAAAGARQMAEADAISARLTSLIEAAFRVVEGLPSGNRFTNANKAMDHYFAHGPEAARVPPPRLHGGPALPVDAIERVGEELRRRDLMPAEGYLA